VEEDINKNKTKNSVDFFDTILVVVEYKSSDRLVETWYLDSGATKHMLRNNSSFKALQNVVKIQNVKSTRSYIHYVHGKGKINIASTSRKIMNITNVFLYPWSHQKSIVNWHDY